MGDTDTMGNGRKCYLSRIGQRASDRKYWMLRETAVSSSSLYFGWRY